MVFSDANPSDSFAMHYANMFELIIIILLSINLMIGVHGESHNQEWSLCYNLIARSKHAPIQPNTYYLEYVSNLIIFLPLDFPNAFSIFNKI